MNLRIEDREAGLTGRVHELQDTLRSMEPAVLAHNTGCVLVGEQLELRMWDIEVLVSISDFVTNNAATGKPLDLLEQAIIAYHFVSADGTPPAGIWISFSELPEGRFYTSAFQGYTGQKLVQTFGNDDETFSDAALRIGGQPVPFGDLAFRFQALPYVPLLVVCWLGDEDLPASYRILFDAHVPYHLPADGCAILGSRLTGMLLSGKIVSRR